MITTSAELEDLIDSTVTIPTIPTILLEINQIFTSPDGSAQMAAEVIEKDPAIAAKVLRLVNSSFYAPKTPVSAIPLACSILGLKVIKNLVVQATVIDELGASTESEFDTQWLWDHSFKTALAARLLCKHSPIQAGLDLDDAYTCGLIHDVGKIILLQNQTEDFIGALRASREKNVPLAKIEGESFGFSHAHVGGLLAQRWKLAESVQAAVMYHHSPATEADDWAKGFLIKAANTVAHQVSDGNSGYVPDISDDDALLALQIEDATLDEIRDEVACARM